MIVNLLKNALIALVLNAGVAYAFNIDADKAAAAIAPAQSCAMPAHLSADVFPLQLSNTGNDGAQS